MRKRQQTIDESSERGQTTQDFAIGVSIMLVTLIAVFGLVQGGVFQAFQSDVKGEEQAMSDRVAQYLITNLSTETGQQTIRYNTSDDDGINETLTTDLRHVRERAGLNVSTQRRSNPDLNIIVVNSSSIQNSSVTAASLDENNPLEWGDEFRGQDDAANTIRVVQLSNDGDACSPTCWIVVRVW